MWWLFIINKIFTPINGLGKRLFLIVSQLTPICNVELVIKNNLNKTLLIFRDDGFYGPGWHLPGGIIRFREKVKSSVTHLMYLKIIFLGYLRELNQIDQCFREKIKAKL